MKYYKEIRFRFQPEEKEALISLAASRELSQSALVRELIRQECRKETQREFRRLIRHERCDGW